MLSLNEARELSAKAHAKAAKAQDAYETLSREWWAIQDEWSEKRRTANTEMESAQEAAYLADADVYIAECNLVADGRISREELAEEIRKILYFRGEYRPNGRGEVITYEERILICLESRQMSRCGLLELPSLLGDVFVNVRGSAQQRELTEKQRERVMSVIAEHCPKRGDGGFATPYPVKRHGKYRVKPA